MIYINKIFFIFKSLPLKFDQTVVKMTSSLNEYFYLTIHSLMDQIIFILKYKNSLNKDVYLNREIIPENSWYCIL